MGVRKDRWRAGPAWAAGLLIIIGMGIVGIGAAAAAPAASEWTHWRGPSQNGVSPETGLVSTWSAKGDNLIWKVPFAGRSTPIVLDGRVCVTGRAGEGPTRQEIVACFDAQSGEKRWEHRFNVFHTTVPFSRVGWASPAGDPETGNLYFHGVAGQLVGFDPAGKVLWERSLTEEFGRFSGYGGRTHSPIVDEDRVIISFTNVGWGEQAAPRHRYFAFDKRSGDLIWTSTPGGPPRTMTTYSTPVVTGIGGRRLLIAGNSDGAVHALKARTGEPVWSFQLGKQGLDVSVAVDGTHVFAATGEEPIDEAIMGRVVCIDGTGAGDVTRTHEVWRAAGIKVGYASPLVHDGRLYVIDDSANLHALDAATGKPLWLHSLGTVGKGSPVWADGKIYATEVNGNVHIMKADARGATTLHREHLEVAGERYAEIFGSPAIAYGRVYFATEEGLYCLGNRKAAFAAPRRAGARSARAAEKPPAGAVALIQIVPAEAVVSPGSPAQFHARAFDAMGNPVEPPEGQWSVRGLPGAIDATGRMVPDPGTVARAGQVSFKAGEMRATARVRLYPGLPWSEDFESLPAGSSPLYWIGAGNRFTVREREGGRALAKPFMDVGLERQNLYIGPPTMSGYTIQADLMGTRKGRRRPDMGLVASGYTLDLMGNHQRLQIRDWAELRLEQSIDFAWETDVWYTMKMRVDQQAGGAVVLGKVWRSGTPEPTEWTIRAEDPVPIRRGSPGLYGYSPTDIFYDNIRVTATASE